MSQSATHSCANCGSPVPNNMRFCPNCGTPATVGAGAPANYAAGIQAPPPPSNSYAPTPPAYQPPVQQGYQQQPVQQGYQPPLQNAQPLPAYARPQKNSSKGMLKLVVILLLLLLVVGTAGYFAIKYVGSRTGTRGSNATPSTSASSPIKTTPINATVNYASVNVTIINAQQATSFADDTGTSAPGALRLNIHALQSSVDDTDGGSNVDQYYDYPSSFALILPGGSKVALVGEKDGNGPTKKGNQTTWIDFPVPTTVNVNQLVLQIGKDTEAQIDIPLTVHADLSQYQPKQVSPNASVQYGGMTWTITTATAKLSDSGAQADKGKRFIVLTLRIDNTSTHNEIGYPPDFVRLQFGATTISESGDTLPTPAAGTSNAIGLVAFMVPQEITTFTLILLPNVLSGGTTQAAIPFQIP